MHVKIPNRHYGCFSFEFHLLLHHSFEFLFRRIDTETILQDIQRDDQQSESDHRNDRDVGEGFAQYLTKDSGTVSDLTMSTRITGIRTFAGVVEKQRSTHSTIQTLNIATKIHLTFTMIAFPPINTETEKGLIPCGQTRS